VAVIAGAIASVAGFGVGSLLTPLVGLYIDIKVAVAVVSIPHLIGTALRYWMLHKHVDWRVLWSFGLTSAAGGLAGAFLGTFLKSPALRGCEKNGNDRHKATETPYAAMVAEK
jgi:uncharacterized membrane protein YfcA